MGQESKIITATDTSKKKVENLSFTPLDFWKRAFSDARLNKFGEVFAEYIVSKALNLPLSPKPDCAMETPSGMRIEVKASAFLSHGEHDKSADMEFSELKQQAWDEHAQFRVGERTFLSHIYIFALQAAKNRTDYDPFDLSRWEFYVLTKTQLGRRGGNAIGIDALHALTSAVSYSDLYDQFINISHQEVCKKM